MSTFTQLERSPWLKVYRGVVILILLVMIGRLFVMSILEHDEYVAKAEKLQNVENSILPKRGEIVVQNASAGKTSTLVESADRFVISATPKNVQNREAFATFIAQQTGADPAVVLAGFQRGDLPRGNQYMEPIAHGLTQADVERIVKATNEFQLSQNPKYRPVTLNFDEQRGDTLLFVNGLFFQREYERVYPEGGLLGQVLGFVDDKGQGQYGLEGQYDAELKGYGTRIRLEKDVLGTLLGTSGEITGQDGTSLELTVDRNVQSFAETALSEIVTESEAKGGSVIVMDPKTGEIIAMASTPTYSPEQFREAAKQDISLFDNPAISKQWEPGSIFKPLVMAAAIDQGVVTPDTKDTFGATVVVDGYTINTALRKSYGEQTMTEVLVNSDNVAMVWLADKMGNQMVGDYISKFGFGRQTGVDLRNEIGGKVLPVNQWSDVARATTSFGQGIAVTPLQIATAYSALGNDGYTVTPHIVKAIIRADGTRQEVTVQKGSQILKKETTDQVKNMLTAVIVKAHKSAGVEGYKLGGKTGTAQVPNPEGPGYLEDQYNHSFAGFGPVDNPRFVILTKVDQPNIAKVGLYAERTASPLFSKIANFLLHYYQIPPTNR